MGDVRYEEHLERVRSAPDPSLAMRRLSDEAVVQALAAASRSGEPYLANVLATEAMNRMRRAGAIAHNVAQGVVAVDLRGRVTFVNRPAERLLGWSRDELAGRDPREVVPLADAEGRPVPPERRPLAVALAEGRLVRMEDARLRRKDGSWLQAEVLAAPVLHEGEVRGAVVTYQDVTERRRFETGLRLLAEAGKVLTGSLDPDETLRRVARLAVPDFADWCGVFLVEGEAVRTAAVAHADPSRQRRAEDLYRRFPPGLGGSQVLARVLGTGRPEMEEDVPQGFAEAVARGPEHLELLREIGLRSFLVVPMIARGRTLGAIALVHAESGRRYGRHDLVVATEFAGRAALALDNARLHAATEEARVRYELAAEVAGDGLWDWDLRTGKVYYSPRWKTALGYGPQEDVGDTPEAWERHVHPEDLETARRYVADFLAGRIARYALEHRLRRKDGTYAWVLSRGTLLRDAGGRPVRLTGSNVDITERKAAEQAARESEARYRVLFDENPQAVFTLDRDGNFLALNRASEEISGYAAEELVGASFVPLLAEEDVADAIARFLRVLDGHPELADYTLVRKDGERRRVQVKSIPLVVGGRVVGLHGIARDVTERSRWEREMEAYRLLVDGVQDYAIYLLDREGRIATWNEGARRLYGWPSADVLGRRIDVFYTEGAVASRWPEQELETAARVGRVEDEGWRVRKDGSRFWANVVITALRDAEGALRGFAKVTQDLTERKRAEDAMERRARLQAAAADFGVRALHAPSLENVFDDAVATLARELGAEYAKVLELRPDGRSLLLRAGVGWRAGLVGTAVVPAGEDSQAGYTLLRDDPVVVRDLGGETRFRGPALLLEHGVVAGVSVVLHGRRGPYGVLGVHTTSRRDFAEEDVSFVQIVANVLAGAVERDGTQRELAARVRERTRALAMANAELEAFTYLVSHDLKEPARAVDAYLRAIEEDHAGDLPEDARELVRSAREANVRLERLLRSLLDLSRAAAVEGETGRVRLADVLDSERCRARFERLLAERGARLHARVPPDAEAAADRDAVAQVLGNLVANAIRHNPSPVPEVVVEADPDRDRGVVRVVVKDNGPGIPAHVREAFERGSLPRSTVDGGFGLAIARRAVERMRGSIRLDRAPDLGGAAVHVTLPLPDATARPLEAA